MKKLIFITSIILLASSLFSQEALKSTEEEYYDFLSLQGIVERPTLGYRTLSDSVWNLDDSQEHVWKNNNLGSIFTFWEPENPTDNAFTRGIKQGLFAKVYGPEWYNSYNSAAPHGQNDGALWQGRGYNTALTGGIRLEGYGFELTFKPQISFSQNMEFDNNPNIYPNTYSYSYIIDTTSFNIDYVQRFGNSSFWNFDWGDSEIRWTWHSLTFGFGTQNPWLGPAILNPMLGSNNAPGYLKFDAGIRKTNVIIPYLGTNLGIIEGRIFVGQLIESAYFDNDESNNQRMLTAMSASYEPSFIPGLTIGLNRVFNTNWRMENLGYILRLFTASHSNAMVSSGNDEDQKVSLFAEWNFPKVGFLIFGEYGIDDFTSNEQTNPFHTAIYTIGLKQIIPLPFGLSSELAMEWNNFEMSQDFQLQWQYIGYYGHGFVKQGYTHKGQILGSGSTWAGNSQYIQFKIYYPTGFTALKFHRYCPNNNLTYNQAVNAIADNITKEWYANYETYFSFGIENNFICNNSLYINSEFNYIIICKYNYILQNKFGCNLKLNIKYCF